MKKGIVFFILSMISGGAVYSQQSMSLDGAIQAASKRIENELPSDTNVAIVNFISSSEELSNYVIDEVMDIFANDKKLNVVERSRIEAIQSERGYQFSGEVADDEIISIGEHFGAEYVITGSITFSGNSYRFRIYAINIKDGIRKASSSYTIKGNDTQLTYFFGDHADVVRANQIKDTDGWENKWFYLSPVLGGGTYNYTRRSGEKTSMGVFMLGVQGQLQLFKYLALEIDLGVGLGEIIVPLMPILGEATLILGPIELNAGLGYTIGAGFTAEGSLGINVGSGILFGEFIGSSG